MRTSSKILSAVLLLVSNRALAADPPATAPTTQPTTTAPTGAAQTPPSGTAGAQTQAPPAAPAPPPPSPEATAEAARQTDLARQALKQKRFTQAAQLFEAAAALVQKPGTHMSAALAWDQADRPERAADAFARALAASGDSDATAKARLDALERSLGTVEVKAPPGVMVQLDSGTEAAAPARLHGVAGIHSLAIAAPDRPIVRRDVRLEPGKPLSFVLKDEPAASTPAARAANNTNSDAPKPEADATTPETAPPPRAAAPTTERAPSGQLRRSVGFTAVGVGVAALGATIVFGVEAIDARNAFNAVPSRPLYDHEQTLQTCTNIALVSGAILVAGGLVLVLWPSGSSGGDVTVGLAPTPGGGTLVGSF
jgi:hypothetical protein